MQVTIELPDKVARQLEAGHANLAEVIERGLNRPISAGSALAEEVIEFLGRGPGPREIIEFRPSERSVQRAGELLDKNRDGILTPDEQAEIEEIVAWNRHFGLIKAQARLNLQSVA